MGNSPTGSSIFRKCSTTCGNELEGTDKQHHQRVLGWIIAFKAFKAITLTALGIVLITTRHSDPLDLFVRLALAVHLPLSSLACLNACWRSYRA